MRRPNVTAAQRAKADAGHLPPITLLGLKPGEDELLALTGQPQRPRLLLVPDAPAVSLPAMLPTVPAPTESPRRRSRRHVTGRELEPAVLVDMAV
jgi:hypothetical protein